MPLERDSMARVSTAAVPANRVMALPMQRLALARFCAPTAWPIITVAPMARPTIITVSICITWLPMETAVVPSTPP